MRLIDADDLKEAVYPYGLKDHDLILEMIDDAPTIDAVPVVHAKWKGFFRKQFLGVDNYGEPKCRDGAIYYCSECNHLWRADQKNGFEDLKKAQWYIDKCLEIIREVGIGAMK